MKKYCSAFAIGVCGVAIGVMFGVFLCGDENSKLVHRMLKQEGKDIYDRYSGVRVVLGRSADEETLLGVFHNDKLIIDAGFKEVADESVLSFNIALHEKYQRLGMISKTREDGTRWYIACDDNSMPARRVIFTGEGLIRDDVLYIPQGTGGTEN